VREISAEIAEHADFHRVAALNLRKVVGISEVVTDDMRASVRRQLGCEIAQIYACAEMGCIALQSAHDDEYLICEETVGRDSRRSWKTGRAGGDRPDRSDQPV
jgi:phenylacetate-coenzyme A ligase PaaK-like adenylate-forming protein